MVKESSVEYQSRRLEEKRIDYRRLKQSEQEIGNWLTEMWRLALYYSDQQKE